MPKHTERPRKPEMLPFIRQRADRPEGFAPLEGSAISLNFHRVCRRLVIEGALHQGYVSKKEIRYFSSAERAAAFVAHRQAEFTAKAAAVALTRQQKTSQLQAARKDKRDAIAAKKQARTDATAERQRLKSERVAKPMKFIKAPVKSAFNVEFKDRKPWQPKAKAAPAQIIYTARTRYTVLPTPAPRNQVHSVSFVHGAMGAM